MDQVAKIDGNSRFSLLGVTDDVAQELRRLLVDPATGRLKVSISGGGTGTVTSVSVVTANGFAGSVANPTTTPAITLTTTITGILQGNGTAISAASTTGSGAVVLADTPTLITPNIGAATGTSLTVTGALRSNTSLIVEETGAGTDTITIQAPASIAASYTLTLPVDDGASGEILSTNGSGVLSWVAAGGTGTVTDVSVVSANGFAGSVANSTTTPAITLTTTVTGILSGNGTAISAASTTGSGAVVLADTPTLITPVLGVATATSINKVTITAPATSATLTLADGSSLVTSGANSITLTSTGATNVTLPTSGTLYGTATGSITSAQLLGSLTDETGTGVVVFNNTPTLVTPVLGVATATSINGLTISTTTGTLTLANGSSLVTSGANSITLTSTGATNVTLPTTGTLATLAGSETLSNKTIASPGITGTALLAEAASIGLDPVLSADGTYTGITMTATAGYTQAFGDLVYLDPTDSRWEAVDANAASGADGDARGILGMVVVAGTDGNACTILLQGVIRADAKFPSFTVNNPIYASETAAAVTQTQPTTTDVVIRIVGAAITADAMYFNPDNTWITHT